ncbi:reprolysin-like metallopeptidase [Algicola sagamiensis]|uniref:reprolysin-like metallopeptidase n=1 Tax=Algicola sagamiensis TaxID=163869 RepID=UPI00036301C9|nr:M12 family metallo-peptidase [Algicola sagamiensis]
MKPNLICLFLFSSFYTIAGDLWTPNTQDSQNRAHREAVSQENEVTFQLSSFQDLRSQAESKQIVIPLPDGGTMQVNLEEDSLLPPSMAKLYPQIKNYVAYDKNGERVGRFNFLSTDIHGTFKYKGERYSLKSIPESPLRYRITKDKANKMQYHDEHRTVEPSENRLPTSDAESLMLMRTSALSRNHSAQRTLRVAFSLTSEFTKDFSSHLETIEAVTNILSGVNAVYNTDLNIKLTMSPAQNNFIYTDAITDPFRRLSDNESKAIKNTEVQKSFHDKIDMGMVLDVHPDHGALDGIAIVGLVCGDTRISIINGVRRETSKSEAIARASRGDRDGLYIAVAHEFGHMLGAGHTFNSCINNGRLLNVGSNSPSFVEPGSGSTIMAYPTACGVHNLLDQETNMRKEGHDSYFHAVSIDQINSKLASKSSCGSTGSVTNTQPRITKVPALVGKKIPVNTPFELHGEASDTDVIKYNWEQMDHSVPRSINTAKEDTGAGPLYRSHRPEVNANTRIFPQMKYILSGETTIGEVYPTTTRDLNFRFSARDSRGGLTSENVKVQTTSAAGPFTIRTNIVRTPDTGRQLVQWNVNGTDRPPVNCSRVNIDLLTVSGFNENTYRVLNSERLSSSIPNDGAQTVKLPNRQIDQARFKVSCADNIFFAVSRNDFEVVTYTESPEPVDPTPVTPPAVNPNPVDPNTGTPPVDNSTPNIGTLPTDTSNGNNESAKLQAKDEGGSLFGLLLASGLFMRRYAGKK